MLTLFRCLVVILALLVGASESAAQNKSRSGLPPVGSEGDCLRVVSGLWVPDACPGASSGAPTDVPYWTGAADGDLSAEHNLGALSTALVINTAGTPSAYAGATCTNQVLRVLSAVGAGTCITITSAYVDSSILTSGGALGTPSSGTATNLTGLPISTGVSGLGTGVATALGVNVGSAGAPVVNGGALGTPSSGTATNLTGTASGLTAGTATVANSGDSATSFFSSGTIEDARLPSSMADKAITGSLNIPNGTAPTTDAAGEIAFDTNIWGSGRGSVQIFDGTANTYAVNVLASDTPSNGECPKWNTGGTITWESCSGGSGTIGGASGNTDNALVRADGTGGSTIQSTEIIVDDSDNVSGAASYAGGSTPATAGVFRGANNVDILCARNAANDANFCLKLNASNEWELSAPLNLTGTAGPMLLTGVVTPSAPGSAEQWYFYADSADNLPKYIYNGESEQTFYTTANPQTTITGNAGTATALAANPTDCSANNYATAIAASGNLTCGQVSLAAGVTGTLPVANGGTGITSLGTGVATALGNNANATGGVATVDGTKTLTGTTLDLEGTGNVITIPFESHWPVAGCNNATPLVVFDLPTTNAPAPICDTGTNTQKGYLAFDDTTDESFQDHWILPTGFTGAIDVHFRWKAAATSGAVGWCAQLIRVPDAATSDPAFPAQAAGNCVSDTAKGTTLQENTATISGVTCTSCAAGDHVYVRISRDANGGAVTDSMTGDAFLLTYGRTWRAAL